ncbi:MAG: ATP-binding cassette domain-containing protein, partial [Agromyces sp.]
AATVERYRAASGRARVAAIRAAVAQAGYSGAGEAISVAYLAIITAAAATLASTGELGVGGLVAIVGLAQFLSGPIATLGQLSVDLAQRRASAVRVAAVLDEPSVHPMARRVDDPGAVPTAPGPTVLRLEAGIVPGLDAIEVARGELLGIALTDAEHARLLVDLLAWRVPVAAGVASVDGTDLGGLGHDRGRTLVHAAPREPALFCAGIADNLLAGSGRTAPDPAILAATTVDEVLTHLGGGIDGDLVAAGRELSGGQRQRMALARALHQRQPVLVLHEPTTAVDAVTESHIADSLTALAGDRTIVLVTERPALLARCSRVVRPRGGARHE